MSLPLRNASSALVPANDALRIDVQGVSLVTPRESNPFENPANVRTTYQQYGSVQIDFQRFDVAAAREMPTDFNAVGYRSGPTWPVAVRLIVHIQGDAGSPSSTIHHTYEIVGEAYFYTDEHNECQLSKKDTNTNQID